MFATFSERAKITMSIERCKISMRSYHLPGLDRERFKGWKGALALNQSRSSTGAFVSSYVQSILGKARARGATFRFLRCSISHVVMVVYADMLLGVNKDWGAGFNIGDRLRTAQCVVSPS